MSKRNRMTKREAAERKASAPPATPGYGTEDQDHPAHTQPDPEANAYENGDTSSWAEDVRQPPYPDGNPPADPGYDVEDQDHPAHKRPPRLPKSASKSLRAMVVKKADKCVRLARHTLGKDASAAMIEDQALDYMDMPDAQLDATLKRLGGGFLAQDDLFDEDVMVEDDLVDDLLAEEVEEVVEEGPMACGGPKFSNEDVMAKLEALASDVASLKSGNQNDPNGKTLAPKPETAAQVQAEAAATAKDEFTTSSSNPIAAMFDQFDTDRDGFVTSDDWKGSKSVFASLDTDKDGIIARSEVIKAFYEDEMIEDDLYDDLDPDEAAMLAEMMDEGGDDVVGCGPTSMEEMVEEGMEVMAAKGKKSDDDEDADDEGGDEDSEEDEGGDEDQDEEADEDSDKEASIEANMFSMSSDPMGLSDNAPTITEEDSLLMSIFGSRTASDDEDADDEDEAEKKATKKKAKTKKSEDEDDEAEDEDEKEATKKKAKAKKSEDDAEEEAAETIQEDVEEKAKEDKKASQRPQPKKASQGVQKVGHVRPSSVQSNEVTELSKLWESEPDVSTVFGIRGSSE